MRLLQHRCRYPGFGADRVCTDRRGADPGRRGRCRRLRGLNHINNKGGCPTAGRRRTPN